MPFVLRDTAGQEYRIEGETRIGRDPANPVTLPDLLVSRMHATIWVEQGALRLRDDGSANGTLLNGNRIQSAELKPGDRIQFGNTILSVEYRPDAAPDGSASTVVRVAPPPPPPASQPSQAQTYASQAYPPQAGWLAAAPPQAELPAQPAYASAPSPPYAPPLQPPYAPPPPVYGVPAPVYAPPPPAAKKRGIGRILALGCLLPIVLCLFLAVGGYLAMRAGVIAPQGLLTVLGLGPGDLAVENRRGDAIRVSILELEPPRDTAPIRGQLELKAQEGRAYRVDVPGRYQIDFRSASDGSALGACVLTVKSGGRYQFVALADSITLSLADPAAATAAGQNIASSALCR